jgi:hypothetical protein
MKGKGLYSSVLGIALTVPGMILIVVALINFLHFVVPSTKRIFIRKRRLPSL